MSGRGVKPGHGVRPQGWDTKWVDNALTSAFARPPATSWWLNAPRERWNEIVSAQTGRLKMANATIPHRKGGLK